MDEVRKRTVNCSLNYNRGNGGNWRNCELGKIPAFSSFPGFSISPVLQLTKNLSTLRMLR